MFSNSTVHLPRRGVAVGLYSTMVQHREALETGLDAWQQRPLPAGDICSVKRLACRIIDNSAAEPFTQLLQMPPKTWQEKKMRKYTFLAVQFNGLPPTRLLIFQLLKDFIYVEVVGLGEH